MELHRLGELPSNFDSKLFNKLYKETQGLRINLANRIDHRRYGVSNDIILSWFDDKFIFVFNKYMGKRDEKHLKHSIINALSLFKCRILRKAYSGESEIYSNTISLISTEEEKDIFDVIPVEDEIDNENLFLELALLLARTSMPSPSACNFTLGFVSPTPTFPLASIRSRSLPFV